MKALARKICKNESGATLVLVAIMLMVIFGFTALAVDYGVIKKEQRRLVTAADAAALAGIQELLRIADTTDESVKVQIRADAKAKAREYALKNIDGVTVDLEDIVISADDRTILVPVNKPEIQLFFARVIGVPTVEREAKAKAGFEYLTKLTTDGGGGEVFPFFINETIYNNLNATASGGISQQFIIKSAPPGQGGGFVTDINGNVIPGNFGFVSFHDTTGTKEPGAAILSYLCSAGEKGQSPGDLLIYTGGPVSTQTGQISSSTSDLNYRITSGKTVGLVPIVNFSGQGHQTSTILGFVMFELLSINGAEVHGRLNPTAKVPEFSGGTSWSKPTIGHSIEIPMLMDI